MKTYTFAEAMAARAEGKRVKPENVFSFNCDNWRLELNFNALESSSWHIETTPTQVPWDCPEDVPMAVALRCKSYLNRIYPTVVGQDGIVLFEKFTSWADLSENYEHTTDGINWKPCTKETK